MSSQTLKEAIQAKITELTKAKDLKSLLIFRSLMSEIKQFEIDKNDRASLNDDQVISVIEKMIKQRKQSIELFEQGGRYELAEKETTEIKVLETYLPKPFSSEEIDKVIQDAIAETQATAPADMGKVMGKVKSQLQGRADMGMVSKRIKEKLSS